MSKNPNKSSSSVKATRQGKDTKKRAIVLKASDLGQNLVFVSIYDQKFVVGTILCPMEFYFNRNAFYTILDKILMGYSKSIEYKAMQKKDRRRQK